MAGFFLGGGSGAGGSHQPPRNGVPPPEGGFFLYEPRGGGGRGEDASAGYATRGFELWQQHGQIYPGGVGVFPDEAQPRGGVSCRDCGNQAKKDCVHLRCRTCCQSRGFACSTHVKSTWVPAAKRRERQHHLAGDPQLDHHRHRTSSSIDAAANPVTESSKRQRELTAASARATTAIAVPSMFGELQESFPAEVSAPASFRCVRVSHIDEGDEVYAYQTAVNIGGHVFKGLLYDHGPEAGPSETYPAGGASTSSFRHPHLHHPGDTGSSSPTATVALGDATINATATAVDQLFDPYPTPLSAFMAGTQFFPHQHRP